jgi:hypothetical protein
LCGGAGGNVEIRGTFGVLAINQLEKQSLKTPDLMTGFEGAPVTGF